MRFPARIWRSVDLPDRLARAPGHSEGAISQGHEDTCLYGPRVLTGSVRADEDGNGAFRKDEVDALEGRQLRGGRREGEGEVPDVDGQFTAVRSAVGRHLC